jgi:Cu/Ag efflux pump CusA
MFPEQRTYSEWKNSTFATEGVTFADGRFGGNLQGPMKSCQDCHMPDQVGGGCVFWDSGDPWFTRQNMPQHSFAGSNTWVIDAIAFQAGFDAESIGLTPERVQAAKARNVQMLRDASDMQVTQVGNSITVRVTNQSAHKLPSGYPEGRRMWVNVRFIDANNALVAERGAYDVASADLVGGRADELQVIVDPQSLAARNLTIEDLRLALANQNQDTSGGDLWEGKRRYVVRTLGQFRSPEQVEGVIITRRDGKPVYVRDVAKARLGTKKPDGIVRRFGARNIAIRVTRESGANVLDVMQRLRDTASRIDEQLKPKGLSLSLVYDETDYINSAIGLVKDNILVGGLLTLGTLLLFLRNIRSTLIVAMSIPVSVMGTFLALAAFDRTLNVISLAGIAFAVGMLIDNSVVVLENIFVHWSAGESPRST